jgi:predicted ATP-dependent protease
MVRNGRTLGVLAGLFFGGLIVAPVHGVAQDPAQEQMRRMQMQMEQMDRSMERMERIREQAHRLEAAMIQEMERLHRMGSADRSRILEHERLRDMSREMGRMAEALRGATERMRDVVRDRQMMHSPEMQQEMERLRTHLDDMCERMEEGLRIMERLRQQLRTP